MHFTFPVSQLPIVIALVAFMLALYIKRTSISTRDLVAFALCAGVLFLLATGALHALHVPNIALHLF